LNTCSRRGAICATSKAEVSLRKHLCEGCQWRALLREAATAHIGFTATDLHGGAAAFTVQLKLTTASLLCVAADHEVIFEGGQPVCSACAPGRAASPSSPSCDICADGYFRLTADDGVSSSCGACPHFALHCQRDATLASLNLKPGYYQHSNTTHVRMCLDVSAGRSASTSACIGSGPWIGTCRPWTTGPYCSLCNASDGSRYYDISQSACLACEGNTVLLPLTIWAVTITITLLVLLWCSWCKPWRCVPPSVQNRSCRTARVLLCARHSSRWLPSTACRRTLGSPPTRRDCRSGSSTH